MLTNFLLLEFTKLILGRVQLKSKLKNVDILGSNVFKIVKNHKQSNIEQQENGK